MPAFQMQRAGLDRHGAAKSVRAEITLVVTPHCERRGPWLADLGQGLVVSALSRMLQAIDPGMDFFGIAEVHCPRTHEGMDDAGSTSQMDFLDCLWFTGALWGGCPV